MVYLIINPLMRESRRERRNLPALLITRRLIFASELGALRPRSASMLETNKAFSSFSVNDIQKAREFYGKTLGLELASGPEGTLVVPLSSGAKALMYPKPNHQPEIGRATSELQSLR